MPFPKHVIFITTGTALLSVTMLEVRLETASTITKSLNSKAKQKITKFAKLMFTVRDGGESVTQDAMAGCVGSQEPRAAERLQDPLLKIVVQVLSLWYFLGFSRVTFFGLLAVLKEYCSGKITYKFIKKNYLL